MVTDALASRARGLLLTMERCPLTPTSMCCQALVALAGNPDPKVRSRFLELQVIGMLLAEVSLQQPGSLLCPGAGLHAS